MIHVWAGAVPLLPQALNPTLVTLVSIPSQYLEPYRFPFLGLIERVNPLHYKACLIDMADTVPEKVALALTAKSVPVSTWVSL